MTDLIFSILRVVGFGAILIALIVWIGYAIICIWLAINGWKRVSWVTGKWPFFYRQWEKTSKHTDRIISTRSRFVDAVNAEFTLRGYQ